MRPLLLLAAATLLPYAAIAEVVDSSAGGFTVRVSLPVAASPNDVYRAIVKVADWWDPAHTFSGSAQNLSLEDKAGGCFCEKLPDHGGVRHMEVVAAMPGKKLVMVGALGPLQSLAATGSMTFQITPVDAGAKVEVVYAVAGYLPAGMNTWAAPVDGVLKAQLSRLKNVLEHGKP